MNRRSFIKLLGFGSIAAILPLSFYKLNQKPLREIILAPRQSGKTTYLKEYIERNPHKKIGVMTCRYDTFKEYFKKYPNVIRIRDSHLCSITLDAFLIDEAGWCKGLVAEHLTEASIINPKMDVIVISSPNGKNEFYNLWVGRNEFDKVRWPNKHRPDMLEVLGRKAYSREMLCKFV